MAARAMVEEGSASYADSTGVAGALAAGDAPTFEVRIFWEPFFGHV